MKHNLHMVGTFLSNTNKLLLFSKGYSMFGSGCPLTRVSGTPQAHSSYATEHEQCIVAEFLKSEKSSLK